MLDIASNGDNLQEKSNLYFWEEYENENVSLYSVLYVFLYKLTELNYEGK